MSAQVDKAPEEEARLPLAPPGPLLPKGRLTGPMPWVIAIMMFLTMLASAAGLSLNSAAGTLGAQLSDRITIQIAEADEEIRNRAVQSVVAALGGVDGVSNIAVVPRQKLAEQLAPWLGGDMMMGEIPIPALVDADLMVGPDQRAPRLSAIEKMVRTINPTARVEPHGRYLAPLARLIRAIGLLAFGMVALMALATGAVVVLAARGAYSTHRATIDIMHLLGATDSQILDLFQRRMVLDTLFGAAAGTGFALLVILLLGQGLNAVTSDLVRSALLPGSAWAILALFPLGGIIMSWLSARVTLRRALERSL